MTRPLEQVLAEAQRLPTYRYGDTPPASRVGAILFRLRRDAHVLRKHELIEDAVRLEKLSEEIEAAAVADLVDARRMSVAEMRRQFREQRRALRRGWPCCVYVIRDQTTGLLKIGLSANPIARLVGLQTANPGLLELVGGVVGDKRLEEELHQRFAAHRVAGEWFSSTGPLQDWLQTLGKPWEGGVGLNV